MWLLPKTGICLSGGLQMKLTFRVVCVALTSLLFLLASCGIMGQSSNDGSVIPGEEIDTEREEFRKDFEDQFPGTPALDLTELPPPKVVTVMPAYESTQGSGSFGEQTDDLVTVLSADLASRLGVQAEDITVLTVEPVEWADSSLGCPQDDYRYLQVITPGSRVTLEVVGEQYTYHSDSRTNYFVLCRDGSPQ